MVLCTITDRASRFSRAQQVLLPQILLFLRLTPLSHTAAKPFGAGLWGRSGQGCLSETCLRFIPLFDLTRLSLGCGGRRRLLTCACNTDRCCCFNGYILTRWPARLRCDLGRIHGYFSVIICCSSPPAHKVTFRTACAPRPAGTRLGVDGHAFF